MSDKFSFRWGVEIFDSGHVQIPNWILRHYNDIGVSNTEMMFIIHLASFKYESPCSEASPSLGTLAKRMGYKSTQGIGKIKQSLVDKGLLEIEERPGKTNLYDFTNLSQKILNIVNLDPPTNVDPPTKVDPHPPTKVDPHPPTKVGTNKKREKEKNNKQEAVEIDPARNGVPELVRDRVLTREEELMDKIAVHFAGITQLPWPDSKPQVGYWWSQLREITRAFTQAEFTDDQCLNGVERVVQYMYRENLTITGPQSIVSLCRVFIAQEKRKQAGAIVGADQFSNSRNNGYGNRGPNIQEINGKQRLVIG